MNMVEVGVGEHGGEGEQVLSHMMTEGKSLIDVNKMAGL